MFRRDVLERFDGFPEDVSYGEEPLLCWRIRNELNQQIHQLNAPMVEHDLAFSGWMDYWRRHVRIGATYAEIALRCYPTSDRLWFREMVVNLLWGTALVLSFALILIAPWLIRLLVVAGLVALVARKATQTMHRGYPSNVALVFGLHTYLAKIPVAFGICKWLVRRQDKGAE